MPSSSHLFLTSIMELCSLLQYKLTFESLFLPEAFLLDFLLLSFLCSSFSSPSYVSRKHNHFSIHTLLQYESNINDTVNWLLINNIVNELFSFLMTKFKHGDSQNEYVTERLYWPAGCLYPNSLSNWVTPFFPY